MNAARWSLLCALLLLSSACATTSAASAAPAGPKSSDLYPLAVGNRWTYLANMLGQSKEVVVSIVSEEGGQFTDTTGARLAIDAFGVRDEKRYLVREPIEVGTAWTNVVSVSSVEKYRILEVGHRCESVAGVFENCVVVEGRNQIAGNKALVNELTFAPSVGLMRVAVVLETEGRRVPQTSLELQTYEVKPTHASKPTHVPGDPLR